MELFPSPKVFLEIGPLSITWYAMFYLFAALAAYIVVSYRFKKIGYTKEDLDLSDYIISTLMVGIVGGRIWYILFVDNTYYFENPIAIFRIWEGGLAIQGGVMAGVIYSIYYLNKHHIDIPSAADAIMPCMLLCQAIGRWGNFINQEAHGPATSRAFLESIFLPEFVIEGMNINGIYYHPTFLYESVLNLIGFLLIVFVCRYFQKRKGIQFFAYFAWYGVVRFFIEAMRTDPLMLGPLRMSMLVAAVFFVFGIAGMIYIHKKGIRIRSDEPYL